MFAVEAAVLTVVFLSALAQDVGLFGYFPRRVGYEGPDAHQVLSAIHGLGLGFGSVDADRCDAGSDFAACVGVAGVLFGRHTDSTPFRHRSPPGFGLTQLDSLINEFECL